MRTKLLVLLVAISTIFISQGMRYTDTSGRFLVISEYIIDPRFDAESINNRQAFVQEWHELLSQLVMQYGPAVVAGAWGNFCGNVNRLYARIMLFKEDLSLGVSPGLVKNGMRASALLVNKVLSGALLHEREPGVESAGSPVVQWLTRYGPGILAVAEAVFVQLSPRDSDSIGRDLRKSIDHFKKQVTEASGLYSLYLHGQMGPARKLGRSSQGLRRLCA